MKCPSLPVLKTTHFGVLYSPMSSDTNELQYTHMNTHNERWLSGTALQLNYAVNHMRIYEKVEDLENSIYSSFNTFQWNSKKFFNYFS